MPSAVIESYSYDSANHVLEVKYHSGIIYRYLEVPETVYLRMKAAMSKGHFLNQHVKGKYRFKKISPHSNQPELDI
jgi:hypothetical protein